MLSDQDLAYLSNKLQVPLIVGDILNGEATLSDEVHYGLHEVISEFQPDTALLAIALSTVIISKIYKNASPSTKVLELECNRMINEYGRIWTQNAKHEKIDAGRIFDVLIHTADDLESLGGLLELNTEFLKSKDPDAAALCKILSTQAKAQAMVAEAFMSTAEETTVIETIQTNSPALSIAFADNVIPFPQAHSSY